MPSHCHISMATLGVTDIAAATAFYKRLGFRLSEKASNPNVSFFQLDNLVFGLFGRAALADDAGVSDSSKGFSGVSLSINMPDEAGVDATLKTAEQAGATITKAAHKTFWGGYGGYFADPEGHVWEVAHNPFFPLEENGRPLLEF